MAGGFGERLWPASSPVHPKQFMALNNNVSFLQESIKRALALRVSGKILIVTRRDIENECALQCKSLAEQLDSVELREKLLKDTVILSEPAAKHTSAAIMIASLFLKKTAAESNHTVLVLTSDHVIAPTETFVSDCQKAGKAAEDGKFVCFTIPPTEPATGYGYIKTGRDLYGDGSVFTIENFEEKPDLETAKRYLAEGTYWWNSGMFAFDSERFLDEMKSLTPEVYDAFTPVASGKKPELSSVEGIAVIAKWSEMEETYRAVPSIAVDKSIAEKTKNAAAVRTNFKWTDVGSWDTFSELCTNPANAKVVQVSSENNFVYSDIPVSLCGVKNLVVVVKNNKLLIMNKGDSALVRDAVKEMEK